MKIKLKDGDSFIIPSHSSAENLPNLGQKGEALNDSYKADTTDING